MTEVEIRNAVRNSERDGFKALFQQYQSYVYAIVWRRIRGTGTAEDAEECVIDVFAHVFAHFDEIRPGSLQGYLSTVANRMAVNCYHALCAHNAHFTSSGALDEVVAANDVQAACERAERDRLLYEAVQSLGEPDATLIVQRYYYERNAKEIAKSTGMSHTAVRSRLSRALKRLKKKLNEDEMR